MTCRPITISRKLYGLLPSAGTPLDGRGNEFTDRRRWNTPPDEAHAHFPHVQHLFTTRQLARARVIRNAYTFLGWREEDLKRKKHNHDPGPFLVAVAIPSNHPNQAADVFTSQRLNELGIPSYPTDADDEFTRNSCKRIGDDLFETRHRIIAVHPAEAHLADHEEILINAAEITIDRIRDPLPWDSWGWKEGLE